MDCEDDCMHSRLWKACALKVKLDLLKYKYREAEENVEEFEEGLLNQLREQMKDYIDSKIDSIVNGAPEVLDTIEEISNALNNDPNFVKDIASQVSAVQSGLRQASDNIQEIQDDIDQLVQDLAKTHEVVDDILVLRN